MSSVPSRSVAMWWFGTEFLLLVVYQLDGLVAVLFVDYYAIHCGDRSYESTM
jgi:hypothetical protein